jgi:hypothetical protein
LAPYRFRNYSRSEVSVPLAAPSLILMACSGNRKFSYYRDRCRPASRTARGGLRGIIVLDRESWKVDAYAWLRARTLTFWRTNFRGSTILSPTRFIWNVARGSLKLRVLDSRKYWQKYQVNRQVATDRLMTSS